MMHYMEYAYGMKNIYDGLIKLLEIKKGLYVKSFFGHFEEVLTINKINHPKYGECLISQNWDESQIKLWVNDI